MASVRRARLMAAIRSLPRCWLLTRSMDAGPLPILLNELPAGGCSAWHRPNRSGARLENPSGAPGRRTAGMAQVLSHVSRETAPARLEQGRLSLGFAWDMPAAGC